MYKVFVDDEFVMECNTVKYAKYIVENSFMRYDAWIFRGNKSYCTKTYDRDWSIFLSAKFGKGTGILKAIPGKASTIHRHQSFT